jgi:hypothetical protein
MENMTTIEAHIRGIAPMLMHNGQLANPRNEFAKKMKQISSIRKKTDDDYEAMSKTEFLGGLYYSKDIGIYMPADNLQAMLVDGAKKSKLGTAFKAAVFVFDDAPLIYNGPRDPEKLYQDEKFVDIRGCGVQASRVMRTRPRFNEWELKFSVAVMPEAEVNPDQVVDALTIAWRLNGLGDYTPRFGRFEVLEAK